MDIVNLATFLLLFIILFLSLFWFILWISELDVFIDRKRRGRYPSLAILIPAYNEEKNIGQTIQSALDLKYPRPVEIVVIDDGSTDGTLKVARQFPVKVIAATHGGKANAVNAGIRKTRSDIIVTLDADSFPEPDALLELIPYLEDDDVGAVTSALKVHSPNNMIEKLQWLEYVSSIFMRKLMSAIGALYIIPGPLSAYKRSAFDAIGLFEVGNITEDTEIGLRMLSHNLRIDNCASAIVHTKAPKTLYAFVKQRIRWYSGFLHNAKKHKNLFFSPEHGDISLFLPFVFLGFFSMFLSMGISLYYIDANLSDAGRWLKGFYASGLDPNYLVQLLQQWLRFRIDLLSIDWQIVFFSIVFFGLSLSMLAYAHRYAKERRIGVSAYILFIFIYYQFMGLVWLASILKWLKGNKEW